MLGILVMVASIGYVVVRSATAGYVCSGGICLRLVPDELTAVGWGGISFGAILCVAGLIRWPLRQPQAIED